MQLLANGKQQFIDQNGAPLASGKVYFYAPATLTPSTTYQDAAGTIPNTNPVNLDSNGQAVIWGVGTYRQIVKDVGGNQIWDQVVSTPDLNAPLVTLSAASGATLVGYSDSTVSGFLQNRLTRVVTSLAGLRALSKTTATQAILTGTTAQGDGGSGRFYLDAADTVSGDNGWSVIVASDGGRWKLLNKFSQATTTATDVAAQFIERTTSHTGGAAGYVNGALRITHTVGAGVTNFEWGITSVMNNSAATGENVAIYGQGNKLSTGPTWGGVMEARDKTNLADPAAGLIGMEIDVFANGTDANQRRIGVDLVAGKGVAGGATAEIYAGIRIGPQNIDPTQAYFDSGILLEGDHITGINVATTGPHSAWGFRDTGSKQVGIELSGTYSAAAIRLQSGSKLAFDGTNNVYIAEAGGVLSVSGSYLNLSNSFGMPGAGNVTATATAGTAAALPATPQGFVSFKIDGTTYKFPYYLA